MFIFKRFLKETKIKYSSHLDMACGTGEVALFSYRYCKNIYGFDISKNMLNLARKKAPFIHFTIQSLTNFNYKDIKFDLITCIYNGFNHLLQFSDWEKSFYLVYKHLNKNGYFFFDIDTIYNILSWEVDYNYKINNYLITKKGIYDKSLKIAKLFICVNDLSTKKKFKINFEVKSFCYDKIYKSLKNIGFKNINLILKSDILRDKGQKLYILASK